MDETPPDLNTSEEALARKFKEAGFIGVGFLGAEACEFGAWNQEWLARGFEADMNWTHNHQGIRQNPLTMEPWAKSIIALAFPYKTAPPKGWEVERPISRYAWGMDYHKELVRLIKPIITELKLELKDTHPNLQMRICVDSAPLPEKLIAQRAGLGFIGRNSLLIHPSYGSFVFLVEILTNLELKTSEAYQGPDCGGCKECLDHCPGGAITADGFVNAKLCASYLTIEKKGELTKIEKKITKHRLFGCDSCQDCCPYNHAAPTQEASPFLPLERWQGVNAELVKSWTEADFETLKINSPLKRAGLAGLKRNAGG
ncbi:MAG: tRNA epoxyqueuosine(34) reductase QueG [SAR324 cluster bacterium]|nr:tRNA epoxyqueuosine(34) reductase QueG [SAR324 cluster bacterium]